MQAHARAVETTRSVSKITMNFFETIDRHASSLTQIVEETQFVNDQKLCELEKKFEVTAMSFLIDINNDWKCFYLFSSFTFSISHSLLGLGVHCL
jgi:hypothetical protein